MIERSALLLSEAYTWAVYDRRGDQADEFVMDFNVTIDHAYSPLHTAFSAFFSRQLMALAITPGMGVCTDGA